MCTDGDPGGVVFLDFISNNYYELKSKLQKNYKSFIFSEDVFHDTIIKMHKIFETKKCAPEIFIKYLHCAFRTNMSREQKFFRNYKTDIVDNFEQIEPYNLDYIETTLDIKFIEEQLRENFGDKLTDAYMDLLAGYTKREIMEIHNIKSVYYHMDKMTDFIIDIFLNLDKKLKK